MLRVELVRPVLRLVLRRQLVAVGADALLLAAGDLCDAVDPGPADLAMQHEERPIETSQPGASMQCIELFR